MELLDLAAGTKTAKRDETQARLQDTAVGPSDHFKSLSVWIDPRLSFKRQDAFALAKARSNIGLLWKLTKQKGISPGTVHHLITSTSISGLTWTSEVWWTEARHVIDQVTPAYTTMARLITGHPRWTPI